jgi:hypothetical protein
VIELGFLRRLRTEPGQPVMVSLPKIGKSA